MRETVLLINFTDKERALAIRSICMAKQIKVKVISKEDYAQPMGYLAGMKELYKENAVYEGEELDGEMMLFAGLKKGTLDYILGTMKARRIAPVACKAMLTDTNKDWTVPALFAELKAEHEYMTNRK